MLRRVLLLSLLSALSLPAIADTVVLREGGSYSGTAAAGADVTFTGTDGVQYTFPRRDVLALTFSSAGDTVSLRSGKSYTGHYTGANPIPFTGADGIQYE